MAHHAQDDGFHEIQLNGKQLVFLFMAATVVSVVIFLCGVLVGRGVRAERTSTLAESSTVAAPAADAAPEAQPPAAPAAAGSDPRAAAPPQPVDDLSYFNRLEKQKAPPEQLKPPQQAADRATSGKAAPVEPRAAAKPKEQPPKVAEAPPPAAAAPTKGVQDTGPGYTVQIAALNVRGEADAIARRLSGKGYAAYVVDPPSGSPSVYRVRVGNFKTRREAESVAATLKREEHYAPWITR